MPAEIVVCRFFLKESFANDVVVVRRMVFSVAVEVVVELL